MALSPSFSTTPPFPRAHTPRIAERPAGGAGLSGVGRHTPRIAERPHTSKEEGSVVRMGDGFGLGRVGQGLVRGGFEFDGCQMIQGSLVVLVLVLVGLLDSGQDCDVWLLAGGLMYSVRVLVRGE